MSIESAQLLGATRLKPLAQGSLSRLCGLYSFLNGIQLALYPQLLSKQQGQELYLHGIGHLARRRQLRHVLGVGMTEVMWLQLGAALVEHVNQAHSATLALRPTLNGAARYRRERALQSITRAVSGGSPVLVRLGGALDHYSVIAGWTDQRLRLFDSSGLRFLNSDRVGIGENSVRRHRLSAEGVVTIHDDW